MVGFEEVKGDFQFVFKMDHKDWPLDVVLEERHLECWNLSVPNPPQTSVRGRDVGGT